MPLDAPICPTCQLRLTPTQVGELDTWVCSAHHGVGITMSEGHNLIQEDEICQIWRKSEYGRPDPNACPMCDVVMATVDATWDVDETFEGEPGDGPDLGQAPVDVCRNCQLLWFEQSTLELFPLDLPDPELTQEQTAMLARIKADTGRVIDEHFAEIDRHSLSERLYRHVKRGRSPMRIR